jgi:hypothetical protein
MNTEPVQLPIHVKILLGLTFAVALLALPFFLGYGMAYPSVLAWSSVALAMVAVCGVVTLWVGIRTSPKRSLLVALLLLATAVLSLQLAWWHKDRANHAAITVNFVRDLNEEYRLLTTLTRAVPEGTTTVEFYHGDYYDRLSNRKYPSAIFTREIPVFERDKAITEKDGRYYVDLSGPDFKWDPILTSYLKRNFPAEFEQ